MVGIIHGSSVWSSERRRNSGGNDPGAPKNPMLKKDNFDINYFILLSIIVSVIKNEIFNFFYTTLKESPSDVKMRSHDLMIRSGMIRQETSGNI